MKQSDGQMKRKALALCLVIILTICFITSSGAESTGVDIIPLTGYTHSGNEITFQVQIYGGTQPYGIRYNILEESNGMYGYQEDEYVSCEESLWEFSYIPHDPTMNVTFGVEVYDAQNEALTPEEGQSITVFYDAESSTETVSLSSVSVPEDGSALFMITEREFTNDDAFHPEYTSTYTYTNEFPDDMGTNPDYWAGMTLDSCRKSVSLCHVGTTPGEICSIELSDINTVIHYCVPYLPSPLKAFADAHGLNVIKKYVERLDDYTGNYTFDQGQDDSVIFYQGQMEISLLHNIPQDGSSILDRRNRFNAWQIMLSGQQDINESGSASSNFVISFSKDYLRIQRADYGPEDKFNELGFYRMDDYSFDISVWDTALDVDDDTAEMIVFDFIEPCFR